MYVYDRAGRTGYVVGVGVSYGTCCAKRVDGGSVSIAKLVLVATKAYSL